MLRPQAAAVAVPLLVLVAHAGPCSAFSLPQTWRLAARSAVRHRAGARDDLDDLLGPQSVGDAQPQPVDLGGGGGELLGTASTGFDDIASFTDRDFGEELRVKRAGGEEQGGDEEDEFEPSTDPEYVPFKLPEGFDLELGFASKLAEAKPDAFENLKAIPEFEPSVFDAPDDDTAAGEGDGAANADTLAVGPPADPFDLGSVNLEQEYKLPEGFSVESLKAKDKLFVRNGIGCGTLAWGSPQRGFGNTFNRKDVLAAYNRLMEGGITFFDTAEVYGHQNMKDSRGSEQLLGYCMKHPAPDAPTSYRPQIATKYMPILWTNALVGGGLRLGRRAVVASLKASLARLEVDKLDLYQIHFPFPYIGGQRALFEGIARCRDLGLCDAVGVSNFNSRQVEKAHARLGKLGVNLVTNQVGLSLANQAPLFDGTVDTCRELGVDVLAHSPLANGLCTGRYTAANPSGASRKRGSATTLAAGAQADSQRFDKHTLRAYQPLHQTLKAVANDVRKRVPGCQATQSQVALNWVVSKGAVPLPGVKTVAQADEVLGCLAWSLDVDDVAALDAVPRP